jgi:hypothetical protein
VFMLPGVESHHRPPSEGDLGLATLPLPPAAEEAWMSIRRFQRTLTAFAPLTRERSTH